MTFYEILYESMKEALNNSMFITTEEDVKRTSSNVGKMLAQYFQGQEGHPAIVFVNSEDPIISLVKPAEGKNENNQSPK